jgi:hypothetical protein
MKEYVITEEQIQRLAKNGVSAISEKIAYSVLSRPLSEHDAVKREVPSSKELILLATTDFKNREERKGLHDQASWTSGWITGFLSERKPYWSKIHDAEIAKKERERVLIPLLNQCKVEELNNKKRCDAGVDNISSFQLRVRQAAFERCAIWIEEILRRGEP